MGTAPSGDALRSDDAGADLAYTRARMVSPTGRLRVTNALNQYWHPEIQVISALFEPARAAYRAKLVEEAVMSPRRGLRTGLRGCGWLTPGSGSPR